MLTGGDTLTEKMSSLERVNAAFEGGTPDLVPVFPRDLTLGMDATGFTTPETCCPYNPVKSSRSVIALQRMMGHDAVVGAIQFMGMELPALGGRLIYPDYGIPSVVEHPVRDPEIIDSLQVPEVSTRGPVLDILESYRLVCESVGKELAVIANVEGPLTKAGLLRGIEQLAMDMIMDPGLVRRLVDFSVEFTIEFARGAAERGANPFCFVASATDNPEIFGVEEFRRFSIGNLRRLTRSFSLSGLGTVFHPHGVFTGELSPLVDEAISEGISGFQFAEGNDLACAKGRWGDRICVMGGIHAHTALMFGPPHRIEDEVRGVMETCAHNGRYIFMCSGSLHRGLPLDNLRFMMRCCRRYGSYDTLGPP